MYYFLTKKNGNHVKYQNQIFALNNTNDQFLLFFNRFAINPSSALKLTEGTRAYFISQDASDVSK